jgi:two-component system alkaline phosphatase synthesis response regulator PhoP
MSPLTELQAKASILIADDDASNREVLTYYLRRQGYDVHAVADGELALAAIAARGFALVLLDVVMPGIDGLEALRRIRASHGASELPVILFTGLDATDALDTAGELGANAWLAKPYQLADLLAAVRAQIASPTILTRTV